MLYGVTVTLGFMLVIFLLFFTLMYYVRKELPTHDAEHVDPLPDKKY